MTRSPFTPSATTVEARIANAARELKNGLVPAIYDAFDAFLIALEENPNNEALLELECTALVEDASRPLYDRNIRPSAMRRIGDHWQMQGFHAVPNLPVDLACLSIPQMDMRITDFYAAMDAFISEARLAIGPTLATLTPHAEQWALLGKVWRYRTEHAGEAGSMFVPPHFDRSVLSVMLDSRIDSDGDSRHLCIGVPDHHLNINAVAATWRLENCHIPHGHEYPIVLAGLHAHEALGLAPVPHSVLRMDPNEGRYRYSLLFFVVPHKGLASPYANLPS